jgi:hypothetical protein
MWSSIVGSGDVGSRLRVFCPNSDLPMSRDRKRGLYPYADGIICLDHSDGHQTRVDAVPKMKRSKTNAEREVDAKRDGALGLLT